ncbi:MAG TPA: response regulator transcription factor [Pyrinomonadaceae bacterium]|jgi:DNA-binding NarL/FixJ family response regulator|nr:response regulator transcription factor [Pyrinomonadaceae bacterium]
MMDGRGISIVLADDHLIVRQGVRALLAAEADFQVIGETGDGLEAVELVKRLSPDVVILDLMMPGLNGIEVARQLGKQAPQTKIIILSMYDDEGFVLEALANGVSAYVLKDTGSADLINAVREVKRGHRYLSPPLSDRAIEIYEQMNRAVIADKYETLTTREREVLHLSAEGLTNNEIANRLGISVRTAETHRANVMHKLDVHTQADLTRYALRRGIISME